MKLGPEKLRSFAKTLRWGPPNEDRRFSPILAGEIADALDGAAGVLAANDLIIAIAANLLRQWPALPDPDERDRVLERQVGEWFALALGSGTR